MIVIGRSIQHGNAVPEHISTWCADQQCALSDGERRLRADTDDAGFVLVVGVEMTCRERIERRPRLSARRNELALVLANTHCCGAASLGGN